LEGVDVALIVVGSTEQHGPQNPLGTDHLVAAAVSREVGDRTGVAVFPTIPIGVSSNHAQFPGSIYVSPETLRDYVVEVAMSAASHGFAKFVIMNGHGGNTNALMDAAAILRRDFELFACVVLAMPSLGEGDGHAGKMETSLNLHYHGHLVHMERAVDVTQKTKLGSLTMTGVGRIGPAQFPMDVIDVSDLGIMGKPGTTIKATEASAKVASDALKPFVDSLVAFVEELKKADAEELLCKPHK
jgi:creatinine amidohydrolase